MISVAYWINPYGKILPLSGADHIGHIIQAPDKFGYTNEEIEQTYDKYNERLGQEGKAREELIIGTLERGFIRIRLYPNRHWSINVWELDNKTKKALSVWAEEAKKDRFSGPHMVCKIVVFNDERMIDKYTVNDLYFEEHLNESVSLFKPKFVKSLNEFENLNQFRVIL
jgi:hypothetical protein